MNQTNLKSPSLSHVARRAIVNAQSGLKFEKDRAAVYQDCIHDQNDLANLLSVSRLAAIAGLLLRATKLAFEQDELSAGAKLALLGLCDWVESEMGPETAEAE